MLDSWAVIAYLEHEDTAVKVADIIADAQKSGYRAREKQDRGDSRQTLRRLHRSKLKDIV